MFVKQVPDTNDVKWTENNNIDRAKMECIINPVDKKALEVALQLKEKYQANTWAVTMGPVKSKCILEEAIAMGIDNAVLLCDSKFAGSDTCATSKVLAARIKEKLPNTDIIIFGQTAIDGETGQTGISTATRLNFPCITQVSEVISISENSIMLTCENETSKKTLKVQLPVALCINNYVCSPRLPKIGGYIKAQKYRYETYNLIDLNLKSTDTGVKGSPTFVSKVFKSDNTRVCKIIDTSDDLIFEIKGVMQK